MRSMIPLARTLVRVLLEPGGITDLFEVVRSDAALSSLVIEDDHLFERTTGAVDARHRGR
jgi:hypothetical protein